MTGSMVAVKDPVVNAPQIGSFSRNVLPQTLQNVTVDLSIDSLALGNEFSMYNMSDVAKKKQTFSRHSHVKIAGYIIHVITKPQISQLAKRTQRCHSAHLRIKIIAKLTARATLCCHLLTRCRTSPKAF